MHRSLKVDLLGRFSNPRAAVKSLIRRVFNGSRDDGTRALRAPRRDFRGPVLENSRKSQTRLNPAKRAALAADYAAGMPTRMLSEKYRVHRGTIPGVVRREGGILRTLYIDEATQREAATLYGGGLTLAQVASKLSIGVDGARNAVVQHGGTLRPKGRPRRDSQSLQETSRARA